MPCDYFQKKKVWSNIVVYVHATVFSKVHPARHNIVNSIKPGSDSRKTDKHAVDCSKAVCWGVK